MPNKTWQSLQAARMAHREAAQGVRWATRHLLGRSLERSPTLRIVTHFDTSSGSPGGPGTRVTGGSLPARVQPLLWLPGARAERQSTELPARSWGHSLGQATQPQAALPHSSKPVLVPRAATDCLPQHNPRKTTPKLAPPPSWYQTKAFCSSQPNVSCKGCGSAELAVLLEQQGK